MGRQKNYNRDVALDQAMKLFWQQGFEATSMQNLTDAMGIYRKSLYDEYGDKHQLYLSCLARYSEFLNDELQEIIDANSNLHDQIRAIFNYTLLQGEKGCLVINSATELANHDEAVKKWVEKSNQSIEKLFEQLINEAIQRQEISNTIHAKILALTLSNAWTGLRVLVKFDKNQTELHQIIEQNLKLF